MKNHQVIDKDTGEIAWVDRSLAVTGIVRARISPESPETFYLLSKRGKNCPDFVGKWQCNCGYIDFDELVIDAALREIKEETGLDIKGVLDSNEDIMPDGSSKIFNIIELKYDDNPKHDIRQNIVFRFIIDVNYNWIKELLDNGTINTDTESRGGEPGEVEEIRLVNSMDLDKEPYIGEFAFNHGKLLKELK